MFGAFLDAAMSIPRMMHDEEMQNDSQQFNAGEAQVARDFTYEQSRLAREFNSAEAIAARKWTEEMANTQHQRGARDMRQAGINPIMSVRQGGAQVGSAAAASSGAGAGTSASSGIASSGQPGSNFAAAQVMEEQKQNLDADTAKKWAERSLASQHYNESQARTGLVNEQFKTQEHLTRQSEAQASIASSSAKGAQLEGQIDETNYGAVMRYIDRAIRALTGSSQSIRNVK